MYKRLISGLSLLYLTSLLFLILLKSSSPSFSTAFCRLSLDDRRQYQKKVKAILEERETTIINTTTTNYLLISYTLSYNLVMRVTLIGIIVIRSTRIKRYKEQGNGFAMLFPDLRYYFKGFLTSQSSLYNIDFHFAFIYFIRHRAKMHIL